YPFFINPTVNPLYENIFILRTIEDFYMPLCWGLLVDPPQEIMAKFNLRWFFKGIHINVEMSTFLEHAFDGPIFAACIHALQNDEQRALFLGAQYFVQVTDAVHVFFSEVFQLVLVCIFW